MVRIAPSLLSADFSRLGDEVKAAQQAGANMIHVDVMDGCFVPNITIGPFVVKSIRQIADVPLDVHLMIAEPERYIEDFVKSGANYITVHYEACTHLHRTLQNIREYKVKTGISLNPTSPLSSLEYVLPYVDMVLIMSVNPGFGGQKFIPEMIGKIKRLRDIIAGLDHKPLIEVDGGIDTDNVADVVRAGADIVVMGSAFFQSGDYEGLVRTVRERCGSAQN